MAKAEGEYTYRGMPPIKNNLRKYREEKGLSQFKLGSVIGLTPNGVLNLEKGNWYPKSDLLMKLCEVFKCKPLDLWPTLGKKR